MLAIRGAVSTFITVLANLLFAALALAWLIVWPLKIAQAAEARGRSFPTWCLLSFFVPGRLIMTIALYFMVIRPERAKIKVQAAGNF